MARKNFKKKVVKHLREDIHESAESQREDRELIRTLDKKSNKKMKKDPKPTTKDKPYPKGKGAKDKVKKVMEEYKSGELHSGSKKGPQVKKRSQAIAIALSEARKEKKKKK